MQEICQAQFCDVYFVISCLCLILSIDLITPLTLVNARGAVNRVYVTFFGLEVIIFYVV